MAERPLLISVLRHGAPVGRANVLRGRSDPPLSEAGWEQMRAAARSLAAPPYSAIVASPRRRCREFAATLAEELGLPLRIEPDLAEIDFGEWEELTSEEAQARDANLFAAYLNDPEAYAPPGGEPFDAFRSRVARGLASLQTQQAEHLLVIAHAGVMRVLLSELLGISFTAARRMALAPAASFRASLLQGHPPSLLFLDGVARCEA